MTTKYNAGNNHVTTNTAATAAQGIYLTRNQGLAALLITRGNTLLRVYRSQQGMTFELSDEFGDGRALAKQYHDGGLPVDDAKELTETFLQVRAALSHAIRDGEWVAPELGKVSR
jgi:hypothetical protein